LSSKEEEPEMNKPTTSKTVFRHVLLGAALGVSACGLPEDTQAVDNTPAFTEQEAPLDSTPCAPPPAAFTSDNGIFFHLYSNSTTWNAAKADCDAMGGKLAVPTSAARNEVIRGLNTGSDLFIGLKQDSGQSSTSLGWRTVGAGAIPPYLNWNPGEPNDSDGVENDHQNCSRMYISDGEWDDVSCTNTTSPYVCEFGAPPTRCSTGTTCVLLSGASTYSCE
jgi:hypothetical protein